MQAILQYLPIFLLIFCRITSFFVVAPVFSTRGVPAQFKIGIAFFISFIIFLTYGIKQQSVNIDGLYVLSILREILAGLLIGFLAYLFFTVVQTAGSFVDMQLGFGIANVIDPMTGASSPILGNFKFMVAILLFLAMNGHHFLISAVIQSYDWVPLSNELFIRFYEGNITEFLIRTFSDTFALAFQMSAPLVVAMFLTDVGLGFLARTVPQFNIFVVGVPLKILVGFLILMLIIPGFYALFQQLFAHLFDSIHQLFKIIQQSKPSA